MNATFPQYTPQRSLKPLLFLILAFSILAITFAAPRAWNGLGLTNHAKTSHAANAWNATTIYDHFANGKCTPYVYDCRDGERQIGWCNEPNRPGQAIGLVISKVTNKIITGFGATQDYWRNACP